MTRSEPVTVSVVTALLDDLFPRQLAEEWDVVGLAVGSSRVRVSTVLFAVDCTNAVVTEARRLGAELIVAHHPLLLRGIHAVNEDEPKGRIIAELVRHQMALFVAHTNADVPPGGVVASLVAALGLVGTRPMLPREDGPYDKLVTFVPHRAAADVITALASAGAGAIGHYDHASFASDGEGTFRPLAGSSPAIGRQGQLERVAERRLEMIMDRDLRTKVIAALRAAHPYETPAFDIIPLAGSPSPDTGLGRIGAVHREGGGTDDGSPLTLGEFVHRVATVLPRTAGGIRVSGDLNRPVRSVAVQAGAGDDLLGVARELGADVYLTSDLRHHPASEAREWSDAPALIDVSHWAAESLWLPVVARHVADLLPELNVQISTIRTDAWDYQVVSPDPR